MADGVVYVKTAKGKAEDEAKPGKLATGLKTLLSLVGDNASIEELQRKLPRVPAENLLSALDRLVGGGFIEIARPPTAVPEKELDFTRFINRPVKEPSIRQRRQAESTIAGIRASQKPGYHVKIINRPAKRIEPSSGGQYSVLIIDGDDSNALIMTRALLLAKFDTRAVMKNEEIITELNRRPPHDVIAMDLVLPDVIGLELLSQLREHPTFKSVPIIVMTAKVGHDDVVAALAYGASGYITKPFNPEALVESVRAILGL
jgi:CheY-like chemotaxis protein